MTEEQIEKSFQKSKGIYFWPTEDYNKSPSVIGLIFNQAVEGQDAYDYLRENLLSKDLTLLIRNIKESKFDLSFIDKANSKVFNIHNINYKNDNFLDFKQNGANEKYFVFVIMESINGQLVIRMTEGKPNPIMINKIGFEK